MKYKTIVSNNVTLSCISLLVLKLKSYATNLMSLPHAKGQQKVRFEDGIVGGHGAVHAQHAQVALVVGGDRANAHQGLHYRDARGFHEALELRSAAVATSTHVPGW